MCASLGVGGGWWNLQIVGGGLPVYLKHMDISTILSLKWPVVSVCTSEKNSHHLMGSGLMNI